MELFDEIPTRGQAQVQSALGELSLMQRNALLYNDTQTFTPNHTEGFDWRDFSACLNENPEMFFPGRGGSVKAVKKVCQSCVVRTECLDAALDNNEQFGIWGGLSRQERQRLRKQRPKN